MSERVGQLGKRKSKNEHALVIVINIFYDMELHENDQKQKLGCLE